MNLIYLSLQEMLNWETDVNNDFWGSILDDLPAELSSNESENNDHISFCDEPLVWTKNAIESDIDMSMKANCIDSSQNSK